MIDRSRGKIGILPLIRDVFLERIKKVGSGRFHSVAAQHFETLLASNDRLVRFEATEEAKYHHMASGNLQRAIDLGRGWEDDARAAVRDLYKRKEYQRCLDLCEAILNAKGPSCDILARAALCLAKKRRWHEAEVRLREAQQLGEIPEGLVLSYAETLVAAGLVSQGTQLLEAFVQVNPRHAYALAALAGANLQGKKNDTAKKYAYEALEADGNCFRALDVASRIARYERSLREAYRLGCRAMSINPLRAEQNFNKVVALIKRTHDGSIPADFETFEA